ncbi:tannase/feruloyl esterase family alpha/beta hydrolase [uncultured Sphingomonas sp.]|uniref:tannase/feruloyl esterase family alpha/beta hydrolase n=1 Tax=uncultured Sphingomonas sp. TaxID=158754 RepID=UPI0025FE244A|nr:tannase/feruloyl esterase family alpha/beta hydrolase [uncultured Sphingomonas sp.]
MRFAAALASILVAAATWPAGSRQSAAPVRPPMLSLPQRATIAPVADCNTLLRRDFTQVTDAPAELLTAEVVPGEGGRPAVCRVTGYVVPHVQFELRLPMQGYTGRYLQIGCGGNCGYVRTTATPACDNDMAHSGAFAVAATDTGHVGNALWARDNPALQRDFAERGVHVVALASKAIIAAFYGATPARSYFQGCSNGGREAMVEAQRHPDDFDGLVAGAPANYITSGFLRFAWQDVKNRAADGSAIFTATAGQTLHAAVMRSCDALDGVNDGQIDEPRACTFDPVRLACPNDKERPGVCLSPAQVATARAFYAGPTDDAGRHLSVGGLAYGSELTWASSGRRAIVEGYFRHLIYGSRRPADLSTDDLQFTAASVREVMALGAHYDAADTDLTRFRDRGGKMIVWEGAADPSAGPNATLNYYQGVRDRLGGLERTRQTMRVFRLPGVYHCRGGTMPYEANFLGAIVNWVERGDAPDVVLATASKPDGGVRTRPIFAYPVASRYRGRGSLDEPASFTGVAPRRVPDDRYDWVGASIG